MKQLLDSKKQAVVLGEMAKKIVSSGGDQLALVGIRTRGVPLAQRLAALVGKITGSVPEVGVLDITLYRDDLSQLAEHPVIKKTEINFALDEKTVFLVDDVLYTGRTIRCALDALFDFGRPRAVKLAVLVDREGRELPIQPDVAGLRYEAKPGDNVKVKFKETDGEDAVDVKRGGE